MSYKLRKQTKHKIQVVLDLDETLIRSEFPNRNIRMKNTGIPDFQFSLPNEGIVNVFKRPFLEKFLSELAEICDVVVFTASVPEYATQILKHIDPQGKIQTCFYRESTISLYGYSHVKSLTSIGMAPKHTIIVDNSPFAMVADPHNAIPIKTWFNDPYDTRLVQLLIFIRHVVANYSDDVRVYLERKMDFTNYLKKIKKYINFIKSCRIVDTIRLSPPSECIANSADSLI